MDGLAASNKNYNLTILSPDIENVTLPNIHYIHLEKTYDILYSEEDGLNLMDMIADGSTTKPISEVYKFTLGSLEGIYQSQGLQTLLNYPDDFKFDIILYDYVLGPILLPFLHRFNYPPLVAFTAFNNPWNHLNIIGGHFYPAYIPFWTMIQHGEMNFQQRLHNTYLYALQNL
jgi:glucuronosyltransferase